MITEKATKSQGPVIPTDFNWNIDTHSSTRAPRLLPAEITPMEAKNVYLVSECLRDGLHGAVRYPSPREMVDYIHRLSNFGIRRVTVGIYSGDDNKIDKTVRTVLKRMYAELPDVTPRVLSLTTEKSLNWLISCKQINPNLESIIFRGTAPARQFVEGWTESAIIKDLSNATQRATKEGVAVIGAVEHATQTHPNMLQRVITAQVEHGAIAFCLADTIGLARQSGAYRIAKYTDKILTQIGSTASLEWHGHRDKGNAKETADAAIKANSGRKIGIHVVSGGIGERAGNLDLGEFVLNLTDIIEESGGKGEWKLDELIELQRHYYTISGESEPVHGVAGTKSGHTTLGIHSAAIRKAKDMARSAEAQGDHDLARQLLRLSRRIYSSVDQDRIGGKTTIGVSPFSGSSNVLDFYETMGGDPSKLSTEKVEYVLSVAKELGCELAEQDLRRLLNGHH